MKLKEELAKECEDERNIVGGDFYYGYLRGFDRALYLCYQIYQNTATKDLEEIDFLKFLSIESDFDEK